ncbi:MAG: hypothetical protein ABJA71_10030, partial [Ginsengibacter sp.]
MNADAYNHLYKVLHEKVNLETILLKQFLQKRNQVTATNVSPASNQIISNNISGPVHNSPARKLCKENLTALERFIEQLKLKSYSPSTIR